MERLRNHRGKNSCWFCVPPTVMTTYAWKLAMENTTTPTGLIFSRQNIKTLPAGNDYSQAARGAYVVAGSDEEFDDSACIGFGFQPLWPDRASACRRYQMPYS